MNKLFKDLNQRFPGFEIIEEWQYYDDQYDDKYCCAIKWANKELLVIYNKKDEYCGSKGVE